MDHNRPLGVHDNGVMGPNQVLRFQPFALLVDKDHVVPCFQSTRLVVVGPALGRQDGIVVVT